MSDHLDVTTSDRGFKWMPVIHGFRDRDDVNVYESSNAEEACIWVGVRMYEGYGADTRVVGDAAIQLPLDRATALAEQIQLLVRHHYQVES